MNKRILILSLLAAVGMPALADGGGAVVGGLLGGAAGSALGYNINGRNGAIVGAALGGAVGASIGADAHGRRYDRYDGYEGRTVYYSEPRDVVYVPARPIVREVVYDGPVVYRGWHEHEWHDRDWHERDWHEHHDRDWHGGDWHDHDRGHHDWR